MTEPKEGGGGEIGKLRAENRELESRVRELEETLNAIRSGEVDAIIVSKDDDQKVYTLQGPDQPYRALVESIREGALTLSADGIILYANARFASMIRVPPDRIIGTSLHDYLCPEDLPAFQEAVRGISVGPCRGKLKFRAVPGSLPVILSMNPLSPGPGSKISVIVTDRKEDEEALRASEERFRALAEAMPQIVWSADVSGSMDYFNPRALEYSGVRLEDLLGRKWESLIHPDDLPATVAIWKHALETGKTSEIDHRMRRSDGEYRWHLSRGTAIRNTEGAVARWIGTSTDVHEMKEAQEILRLSTEWLGIAQQAAHAGFWDWDLTTGKLTWSDEMFALFGLSRAVEESFDTWLGTVHPDDRTAAMEKINRSIEQKTSLESEYRILLPDGTERWVGAWGNTFYDAAGEPLRMSGICLDITERKRAEEALCESEESFKTLYRDMPISAVVFQRVGQDFVIREYNQASQVFTRGTMENFVGKAASELYRSRPDILEKFVLAWETKSTQNLQSRYRTVSTGQDIFLNMTLAYVPPDRILVLSEDNTELRKYEWELRETSQYLENLINHANAPIIVWDPQFRINRFNHAFERLTGRAAEEVLGMDLGILFPEVSKKGAMDCIRRTMVGERWDVVEIPILTKNGEVRTVLWNSATLYGPDGKTVESAIAQGQDITERKRMEDEVALKAAELAAANVALREEITQRIRAGEALRKTMSLLKATFESTADGILNIDSEGKVAGYNQNFITMWNVPFALLQTPDEAALLQHMAAQLVDPEGFLASTADL
ncbi:MAG: PAS domain S-box protein, partial [Methanomicrobiales archaeon]|nr:PAS domain S-box protein [Methanomicrobiales archaeon]